MGSTRPQNKAEAASPHCLRKTSRILVTSILLTMLLMSYFTSRYKLEPQMLMTSGDHHAAETLVEDHHPAETLDEGNHATAETMDEVFTRRLDLLNQSCTRYNLDQYAYEWSHATFVFYTHLHTLWSYKVCLNFKTGSESWKSLAKELVQQNIPPATRDITLLTVRHPFSRIVS
ncbi:unnamed protein product, partial [Meganyctiphanes norvegica]